LNTAKKTIDLVYKTWLAGVGTYDSGREKAANKFDQLIVDGSAFVNDLLVKGELIETQLQAKIEVKNMLKDKISALRAKLGFGNESRDRQVDVLSQRVDTLIEVVAKLAQQTAAEKKTTVKTSSTETLAEPAAVKSEEVKPASAKPAAVKSTAAKPAAVKSTAAKPAAVKSAAAKPAMVKPAAAKPAVVKSAAAKPAAVKSAAAKPAPTKSAADKPAEVKSVAVKPAAANPEIAKPKAESKD
jgi:polyhydroxyalkanoate synthesis regulator phasin